MLKNKDGQPYKLSHPNPLMKNQELWNAKNIIFHNQYGKETIIENTDKYTPSEIIRKNTFLEELKQTKEEPKKEEKIEPPPPEEVKKEEEPEFKVEIDRTKLKNIVIIYCLPALKNSKFGNKISFEGIVIALNDLTMQFWTTYKISKNSIVYPMKYADRDEPFGDRRWWKVIQTEDKEGGFLVQSMPSNEHPYFGSEV